MQAWLDAAASCGLEVMEVFGRSGLTAWVGLLEVRIEPVEDERQRARIVIVLPGPLDFLVVRIRPESGELQQEEEIEIGDAPFDSRFSIQGPRRQVLALLDAWTRRLLLRVSTECRLEISTGSIRAKTSHGDVPRILPLLLDLARQLTESLDADVPRRLVENVKRDPEAGVRLQNLLLIREHPEAAKEMGTEGHAILLELAEIESDDAISAKAVAILDRDLPLERAATILELALDGGRIRTARACLEVLGRSGSAAAEPPLIRALEHENTDVQAAAVNALGRVGTAAAVLPLRELADRFWLNRDLRRVTQQAIEEIHSRLPGAAPGQLSLAGAETGQLSLAQAETGQLSLTTEQDGQLSLSDDEEG